MVSAKKRAYKHAVVTQFSYLQPEKCLKENHSANKSGNNAVPSACEFCARLNRVDVFIVSFETTTGDKETNSREKEKAGGYCKVMHGAVISIVNSCPILVLAVVSEQYGREEEAKNK